MDVVNHALGDDLSAWAVVGGGISAGDGLVGMYFDESDFSNFIFVHLIG